MLDTQEICTLFDASLAVVGISSPTSAEYTVTQLLVEKVAAPQGLKPYFWDLAAQMQEVELTQFRGKVTGVAKKPATEYKTEGHPVASLLTFIQNSKEASIFIVADLHYFLSGLQENPAIKRSLITTCFALKRSAKRMVILGQILKLPDEFEGLITEMKNPLPEAVEVQAAMEFRIADLTKSAWNNGKGFRLPVELTPTDKERLILALQGLTIEEIDDALQLATFKQGQINAHTADLVVPIKMAKLKKRGVEYAPPADVTVGGLSTLQEWANTQAGRLKPEAKTYGIPYPSGALLIGYGGTGKSLWAKSIGATWHIPILSLDMGKMMSSQLGSSEANLRGVLETADVMSPCILLIDELDKAFAGMNGPVGDSGTFQRMIGHFLQWFNDKTSAVFVVATANRIQNFTPELLRRFDEIFYVDLPSFEARQDIFNAHLAKYQIKLEQESIETLANSTENYTGAEIGKIVLQCAATAFAKGTPTQVNVGELMAEIQRRPPQALSDAEEIEALRQWARSGGARFAAEPQLGRQPAVEYSDRQVTWRNNRSNFIDPLTE